MVEITLHGSHLRLEVKGLDKLWSFTGSLEIPVAHIRGVRVDAEAASAWWKGIRAPGTSIPGVIRAGTFYQDGKRVFWDVHHPEKTIHIELHDEHFDALVVEVADPQAAIDKIQHAMTLR
jgi:hypothetical protein